MQERHLEELTKSRPNLDADSEDQLNKAFAEKIESETDNLPDDARTPDAVLIAKMRRYVTDYREKHPHAREREIRRAVRRKFRIVLLPDSHSHED